MESLIEKVLNVFQRVPRRVLTVRRVAFFGRLLLTLAILFAFPCHDLQASMAYVPFLLQVSNTSSSRYISVRFKRCLPSSTPTPLPLLLLVLSRPPAPRPLSSPSLLPSPAPFISPLPCMWSFLTFDILYLIICRAPTFSFPILFRADGGDWVVARLYCCRIVAAMEVPSRCTFCYAIACARLTRTVVAILVAFDKEGRLLFHDIISDMWYPDPDFVRVHAQFTLFFDGSPFDRDTSRTI